ncbi:MAG: S8 family serine peptidase, partial [Chloroflexi bacterium]|nr:S8 family serine peptidase [Chloroflexota bacterium]
MSRRRLVLLSLGVIAASLSFLGLFASGPGSSTASGAADTAALSLAPDGVFALKHPKLDSHLVLLAGAAERAAAAGRPLTPANAEAALPPELRAELHGGSLRLSDAGEVQVFIYAGAPAEELLARLRSLGARIERVADDQGIVQAQVPAARLRAIAALPQVRRVELPVYPTVSAGSFETEGDAILKSSSVRSTFGVNGSGVTVGVISDGIGGRSDAQSTGDLLLVDTRTCNATGGNVSASGAEGTAMLEIVHDVAPGASLMFGNFSTAAGLGTALDFNAAVNCLAQNADVVVDDIAWFGVGPYDGTSIVSQNTAAALNGPGRIRGYYTAAGNAADRHYQGAYVDSGEDYSAGGSFWSLHAFDTSSQPLATVHAGLAPAPASFNRFILAPGGAASIILMWNERWGQARNDYDLFVRDGQNVVTCGTTQQTGSGNPTESCTIENTSAGNVLADIMIGNYRDQAGPVTFDLFLLCLHGCITLTNDNLLDFNTTASSVAGQSDAGGSPVSVVTVGAVRYSVPVTIARYSGRGPTEDGRTKPDLVATDGVCVSGAGGFKAANPSCQGDGRRFSGTSAAAPHVAGIAALLLQCNVSLSREELRDALLDNAHDLGPGGMDGVYGHGRVDALASAR